MCRGAGPLLSPHRQNGSSNLTILIGVRAVQLLPELQRSQFIPFIRASFSGLHGTEDYSAASCAAQLSPEVRDLLDRILVPDEKERITVPQIQAHPWCAPRFSSVAQHTCLLHFCAFHAQTSPCTKTFTLGKCRMPVPLPYSYPTGGEFSRMSAGICCRRYCSGWNRI